MPYFENYENILPPVYGGMSKARSGLWHILVGLTVGFAVIYLHWRWTESLNPEHLLFSIVVAAAETLAFVGSVIFFFDIWSEGDTETEVLDVSRSTFHLRGTGHVAVDIFITTYDEGPDVVRPSIKDALKVRKPLGVTCEVFVLDDGDQSAIRSMCSEMGVRYLKRSDNKGFKAGNLRNAIQATSGDFIVICDADTRLFETFLENTLSYFSDRRVAWVQTPHWFYDVPKGWSLRKSKLRVEGSVAAGWIDVFLNPKWNKDPFGSSPNLFFDIIQRRRNRSNISFCCGAGSIHRREAVLSKALCGSSKWSRRPWALAPKEVNRKRPPDLEPFAFHVSEDLLTSLQMHQLGWKSIFHSTVEARMLSPWSLRAWTVQRWKYAGGTFDIFLRHNALLRKMRGWTRKAHYLSTFLSYISVLWMSVLIFGPVFSLFTSWAPVESYSLAFFTHLLPVLILNEIAMYVGCKGYDTHVGRSQAISTLPILLRSGAQVLRGDRPRFPATPKTPGDGVEWSFAADSLTIILFMFAAVLWGGFSLILKRDGYDISFVVVNSFWIVCCTLPLIGVVRMAIWNPGSELSRVLGENSVQSRVEDNGLGNSIVGISQ